MDRMSDELAWLMFASGALARLDGGYAAIEADQLLESFRKRYPLSVAASRAPVRNPHPYGEEIRRGIKARRKGRVLPVNPERRP